MINAVFATCYGLGAGFGLALSFTRPDYLGAIVFVASVCGLVASQYLKQIEPRVLTAEIPEEFKELKTRVANLELKSGFGDRRLFNKRD